MSRPGRAHTEENLAIIYVLWHRCPCQNSRGFHGHLAGAHAAFLCQ
jgi:hypothetical protein